MTVKIHSLQPSQMSAFLERRRATLAFSSEMNLADNLAEILRKANEFVPSGAGSILLDNPLDKKRERADNELTFVAAFGPRAEGVIGRRIAGNQGIAGHVYVGGQLYHAAEPRHDEFFDAGFDATLGHDTESIVAVPIRIEQDVCGVLELINRQPSPHETTDAPGRYSEEDRNLLRIFAGYISVSIQNILDGRRAQELAKRDNLTGLFNDHYLHVALSRTIAGCLERKEDLSVVFLDLDYFKSVNDTHGHLAGSQVLREVGHLLKATTLEWPEAIPARYGGDEFVLVVPRLPLEEAVDLAERIRDRLVRTTFCAKPGDIQRETLNLSGITCSIGVASLERHVHEVSSIEEVKSTILRLADTAMYVAKKTGRNRTAVAAEPVQRRQHGADA